jgi:hypothetical protein
VELSFVLRGERKSRLALLTQLEFSGLRSGSTTLKVKAKEAL